MGRIGYTLMCEQHPPRTLVRNAVLAEQAGFDFAVISDHFHPWLDEQANSPFAWSVLGAVAERTERLGLMTMVTCPFVRYHPAIVAQAAATVGILSGRGFVLGLGAGELLNEHVVGEPWPSPAVRHEMLEESIAIIRALFSGGEQSYRGRHLSLDRARLYNLPEDLPTLAVAAGGPHAARLAAEAADALIAVAPDAELVEAYREAGGQGARYGQVGLCWAETEDEAVRIALEQQRFAVPGWLAMSELPTPASFAAATATVDADDIRKAVPCGPDPERHAQAIQAFIDAGFDHVALLQAGPDQEGFIDFYVNKVAPLLDMKAVPMPERAANRSEAEGAPRSSDDHSSENHPSPAELISSRMGLKGLAAAVQACRGCELWQDATQAVFGAGAAHPSIVLIGEQPGDVEDRKGEPFVGPAGTLLRRCLADAGIDMEKVWMTNAVKHFRWGPPAGGRGKRRIHRKPDLHHVEACAPWLEAELERLRPEVTICLGATAAQALFGKDFRVTKDRGVLHPGTYGLMMATVHPSSLLREPDPSRHQELRDQFVADLAVAARHVGRHARSEAASS